MILRNDPFAVIDWLAYILGTLVIGGGLAVVIAMFKIGPGKPEFSFGKALAACLLLVGSAPFLFVEGLTRAKLPAIAPAVAAWYKTSNSLSGKIVAKKVLWSTHNRATVLVIGQEPEDWGGMDRPAILLTVENDKGAWRVTRERVMRSIRLDKDEFMFPPYQ